MRSVRLNPKLSTWCIKRRHYFGRETFPWMDCNLKSAYYLFRSTRVHSHCWGVDSFANMWSFLSLFWGFRSTSSNLVWASVEQALLLVLTKTRALDKLKLTHNKAKAYVSGCNRKSNTYLDLTHFHRFTKHKVTL